MTKEEYKKKKAGWELHEYIRGCLLRASWLGSPKNCGKKWENGAEVIEIFTINSPLFHFDGSPLCGASHSQFQLLSLLVFFFRHCFSNVCLSFLYSAAVSRVASLQGLLPFGGYKRGYDLCFTAECPRNVTTAQKLANTFRAYYSPFFPEKKQLVGDQTVGYTIPVQIH